MPTTGGEELNKDVELIMFDQSLMNATPHWILLAADKGNRQDIRLKYIDGCNLTPDEKKAMSDFLKEMWRKYPVKFAKNGRYTNVSFDLTIQNVSLTDNELAMLSKIDTAISDYMNEQFQVGSKMGANAQSGGISPMWLSTQHSDITYDSCVKMGFPNPSIAADAAWVPDTWSIYVPPGCPTEIVNFLNQIVHGYYHYYNPYLFGISGYGGAPGQADSYGQTAKTEYDNGQTGYAAQDLGYSSHFTEDVGCPLHTGAEVSQGLNQWVHSAYEVDYVDYYWTSEYNFKSIVTNNYYYVPTTSISGTTVDLAKYTNQYCGTVFDTIYNNPNTYRSNANLRSATENALLETSKREMGVVKYTQD